MPYEVETCSSTEELISQLTSSTGIRGMINRAKNRAVLEGIDILKNYFGVELEIHDSRIAEEIFELFERVTGKAVLNRNKRAGFPFVYVNTVVRLDSCTYCYIDWRCSRHSTSNPFGYFYLCGKHCYKYYNYIDQKIIHRSNSESRTTDIYTISASERNKDDWQGVRKVAQSRSFDTLYFDEDIEQVIKTHIDTWRKNEDIYKARGITFKTGILLYGSPGTGKSSIAAAIADYLDCNIILIDSATFKDLNVNEVSASIKADRDMYVVLLDDIDVILTSRTDDKATTEDKAAISKLLGFLDSSSSPDNVVFVATTNHFELFDEAIRRAGRFDKIIKVDNISEATASKMCRGFGLDTNDTADILNSYARHNDSKINPAELQVKILDRIRANINKGTEVEAI